ncbi:alpha globin regulatory element [Loa loa]|uniref:GATOR complex protein NPRL3 n=1 Tax=Loa loa TaxID=7209 RepID=A0A1I7W597_LOALO|nr:alpha globin regulatory element [Loa loa]EFO23563.2 alpha globin regulatory element [Loa loa]
MDDERYLYSPLGIMFVTMGENHEQVSFAYPFQSASSVPTESQSFPFSEPYRTICAQSLKGDDERNQSDAEQYGVPTKILAHLLSARGTCEKPFEIKIDNIRFAGFPKTVSRPTGRSPQTFHVVFILNAKTAADLVTSFQELSRKIAIAIDEEQTRCDYLAEQMTAILNEHEKNESLPESQSFPYHEVLTHCSLAQDLRDIFNDVSEYGVVHIFLNDCIEVGFCVQPRALLHAGLTPKTKSEIEATILRLKPYHGILLLEDTVPGHDSNPALHFFLKHCHPDQSLMSISDSSGLPLFQVLTVVRHLLLWARAIVIYPLCSSNVYTSATSPKPLSRLSEQFGEIFENAYLPTILAEFSPPCTLAEFMNASMHSFSEQQLRLRMVARLLRDELIMQLHTFLYLMPPFSHETVNESIMDTLQEDDNIHKLLSGAMLTSEIKASVIQIYKTMLKQHPQRYVEDLFDLFLRMTPYLHGEHHIEDIMYRMNLERSSVMRVLDTFACVIAPFMRPEYV